MSDLIDRLTGLADQLDRRRYPENAALIREAIDSLRQVPEGHDVTLHWRPLLQWAIGTIDELNDGPMTAGQWSEDSVLYANARAIAFANPAPPTSGDPLNALADDEAERLQYERDKRDPANCLTDATPAQAGTVGNGERWLRSLIGTLDADADTLMLLAAQRITGGAQAGAELPEPAGVLVINGQALRGFTADQMREMYRRAYAELARRGGSDG